MKLGISERINLLGILPTESNYVTLKIVADLKLELSFSEDEIKENEIESHKDGEKVFTIWNQQKAKDKDVSIGEKATDIIVDALKKLDGENKINDQTATLYEKFIINKE